MMIVDINNDGHRTLLVYMAMRNVKVAVQWQRGSEYCIDFPIYEDYSKSKKLQIELSKIFKNVHIPYVG